LQQRRSPVTEQGRDLSGALEHLTLPLDAPINLGAVLGPLVRGAGDPTLKVTSGAAIRASVTAAGPGTIEVRVAGSEVRARAWGPGAAVLLDGLPSQLGLDDDDSGFDPGGHPVVASLARRSGRVRLGRTGAVWEALLPAILEQKITGTEAWRSYRRLVRQYGSPAPGPFGLLAAPPPSVVAGIPQYDLIALGIEPRRATVLRRVAAEARRLEAMGAAARQPGGGGQGAANLASALRALPGVGPWTAAEVTLRALGDPDAVSVGDFHLAHVVGFALAGRHRSTDEEMLELLAPWAGHRARVIRLLEKARVGPPRRGPRMAPRDLARDLTPPEPRRGYRQRRA
jgi:3-methyladenine DNA glycosylase/8-oxoguanine DNA glycosylase